MKEQWQKTNRLIFALILLSVVSLGFGQPFSLDQERMNRDLRIMEGILDKLLKGKSSHRHIDGVTRGVYLQGFGIAFYTEHETFRTPRVLVSNTYKDQMKRLQKELTRMRVRVKTSQHLMEEVEKQKEAALEAAQAQAESLREEEADTISNFIEISMEETEEEIAKTIESIKENILVFFQNYASAIGQLQPQDRIAVLVKLDGWELTGGENGFLTAVVTKQDINRYRRHEVEGPDFEKLVHFRQDGTDTDIDRDINIMVEILGRAMRESSYGGGFSPSGLYLEDLGAVFFMDLSGMSLIRADDEDRLTIVTARDVDRAIAYSYAKRKKDKKDEVEKKRENSIKEIQDELFEILASYGHTLRLKPQEKVIVNVDLGRHTFFWSSQSVWSTRKATPQYLILQITKQDLDAYDKGSMSLDELRSHSIYQTY